MQSWHLSLHENHSSDLAGAVELGRQSAVDEPLHLPKRVPAGVVGGRPLPERFRIAIAPAVENAVSRSHALLEPLPDGGFRLTNLSNTQPIRLPDSKSLAPLAHCTLPAGSVVRIGATTVTLAGPRATVAVAAEVGAEAALQSLSDVTRPPGEVNLRGSISALPLPAAGAEAKGVLRLLQTTIDVLQATTTTDDFFGEAARALVALVDLDRGQVLLRREGHWHRCAQFGSRPGAAEASTSVLGCVEQHRRTYWQTPSTGPDSPSTLGLDAVIAAPILNRKGEVVGALYGDRRLDADATLRGPITELHALLVELLARGIAAGLARIEQEQAALAMQVRLEQFFTPKLARHLAKNADLVQQGRDLEVSVLFCDVRGFSGVAERLEPRRTVEWLRDIMTALSDCVLRHEGVVVDYVGDEVMAMWGAPEPQADHAKLACRAALDMLAALPALNERWKADVGAALAVGVGINSGVARVGNVGAPQKFKYGPLGNTVNLASRVQGATKYLKCPLLLTGTTRRRLDDSFATRRVCSARVVNIAEPVELYELAAADRPGWQEARAEYTHALAEFERKDFGQAARRLGNLRARQPDDGPSLILLKRAVECMADEPDPFDPVWVLPGK